MVSGVAEWMRTWGMRPDVAPLIRQPGPEDQGYITSTWANSLAGRRANRGERARADRLVDRLLDRPESRVLVAAERDNRDRIKGWICYAPLKGCPVLHYVYVRAENRGERVASLLLIEAGIDVRKPFVFTMMGPSRRWITRHQRAVFMPASEYLR